MVTTKIRDFNHHLCGGLTLVGQEAPTKATLSLPILSKTGKRKYNESLVHREKDRERSLTNYCNGKTESTWGN